MIKLVVGLGNPGRQYERTRHNAGFLFLDRLSSGAGVNWIKESRFDGVVADIGLASGCVKLLKPGLFMNRSGQSVGKVARYYKFVPEEILVIHDELDFNAGLVRLKKNGGHAGHNGLKDIIAHLGSKEFYRLRFGIGRPSEGRSVVDYVLSSPAEKEMELIQAAFDNVESYFDQILFGDIAVAMNKLNSD